MPAYDAFTVRFRLARPANDNFEYFSALSAQGKRTLSEVDLGELESRIPDETDARYDVNRDGSVTGLDASHWATKLYGTVLGDANLDFHVDFDDFLKLSAGFDQPGGWVDGDFDGDGQTKFADFLMLSDNYGKTAASGEAANVPEPSFSWLLIIGTLGVLRRRQSRQLDGRVS